MSSANVRSVDALRDTKAALITFAEEARVSLDSFEMELRQLRNWLERDQLSYWRSQVKRGQELVAMARSELFRRQLSQSEAVSDTEQKEALRLAKRRLEEAEDKVERIKKWTPVLEHAISEYHSQSQPLGDRLSGSLVASLATLDRMIAALESYIDLAPPTAPVMASTGGSSTEPMTAGTAEDAAPARAPVAAEAPEGAADIGHDPDRPEERRP
jgi:hypothetical protein